MIHVIKNAHDHIIQEFARQGCIYMAKYSKTVKYYNLKEHSFVKMVFTDPYH